jgi:hypothetical protein
MVGSLAPKIPAQAAQAVENAPQPIATWQRPANIPVPVAVAVREGEMTVSQPTLSISEASSERLARYAIGALFILMGLAFLTILKFSFFDLIFADFAGPTFAHPGHGAWIFNHDLFEGGESIFLAFCLCLAGGATLRGSDFGRKLGLVMSVVTLLVALFVSYLAFMLLATIPRHNLVSAIPFAIGYPACVAISLAGLAYYLGWGKKLDRGQNRNWLWAAGGVLVLGLIVAVGTLAGVLK